MSNEKFTIKTLIEFLQAAPYENEVAQFLEGGQWHNVSSLPTAGSTVSDWRWPPQPKIIDMSYMINNGVDCEFSVNGGESWTVGKLKDIVSTESENYPYVFISYGANRWKQCRPRMNEWLAHTGDKCPVPEGFVGKIRLANGAECAIQDLTEAFWGHTRATARDIVQFMITGTAEGYCYRWEV